MPTNANINDMDAIVEIDRYSCDRIRFAYEGLDTNDDGTLKDFERLIQNIGGIDIDG